MDTSFDAFLQQCWADHAERPADVAERLRSGLPPATSAAQLSALVRVVVHVCGEHLGAFDDARGRLTALAAHPLADAVVHSALRVGTTSLALADADVAEPIGLSLEEHIRSEAAAAAISLGRQHTARAMTLLAAARRRLAEWPDAGAAVHRPLAVACNNMAWELHDRGLARSADDSAAMLELAAASRLHWSHAGGWLEVQRADYALALCHLSAGLPREALAFATQGLAGCNSNEAPAFEHFHAHEALARVQHALGDAHARASHSGAAAQAFERLDEQDQHACRATLATLHALGR